MTTKSTKAITIANFTYEKTPGVMSDRKLIVLSKPSKNWFGVEINDNDLTPVQPLLDYLAERQALDVKLRAKYGIKDADLAYKQFNEDKIVSLIESTINL